MNKKWSNEDIEYLRNNYLILSDEEIAEHLNKSVSAVNTKRYKLRLVKYFSKGDITEQEIESILNDYINGMSLNQLREKYQRDFYRILDIIKENTNYQGNNRWTKQEIEILKSNYEDKDWDELLKLLPNKNKQSIIDKASDLKIKKLNYYWNDEDVEKLKYCYSRGMSMKEIQKELNNKFSMGAIANKASKLKLNEIHWWQDWEIEYLRNNFTKQNIKKTCGKLKHRTKNAIICKGKEIGLETPFTWKKYEDDFVKENYLTMCDKEIADILDTKTKQAVMARRLKLGLHRPTSNTYGNGVKDEDGNIFGSQSEKELFTFITKEIGLKYLKHIGNNHKKTGKYVFVPDKETGYERFYPDFVLEYIEVDGVKRKLLKPLIIEYYGIYNEKKHNKIVKVYVEKTKKKEEYYKNNPNINYIGIFPDDIKNNYQGVREKLTSFSLEILIKEG